ncbi:hypothetical protein PUN4_280023 [Paraburkholderia unamae]|nr:hypothetical protein PUN4_280023 [Paraburkholderia unamae]
MWVDAVVRGAEFSTDFLDKLVENAWNEYPKPLIRLMFWSVSRCEARCAR